MWHDDYIGKMAYTTCTIRVLIIFICKVTSVYIMVMCGKDKTRREKIAKRVAMYTIRGVSRLILEQNKKQNKPVNITFLSNKRRPVKGH